LPFKGQPCSPRSLRPDSAGASPNANAVLRVLSRATGGIGHHSLLRDARSVALEPQLREEDVACPVTWDTTQQMKGPPIDAGTYDREFIQVVPGQSSDKLTRACH
jgi:hypothetical protein